MKTKTLAISGVLAAIYVVLTLLSGPFAYGWAQFRVSEMMNHLVVYNKKYFPAIIIGVIVANFFSSNGLIDLVFGVAQSVVSLGLIIFIAKFIKNKVLLMAINTVIFGITMSFVAFMLKIIGVLGDANMAFGLAWFYMALGEMAVMSIGMLVMYFLNKRIDLSKAIEK
ncbi:QueT transporter family protein [Brochothrix thermosphacta]|uniref:QueT transporter family protein n=1 Tax=Brochothrix thermosphacta TaxID=2756 RepID=UPI0003E8AB27|nr:QueT transporter family protein [Brochothrix thermosphacta]EUJ38682.1 citrulline related protein [Brochothrix thermosphacta DSM 20171 = FSL F6-1036]ODJ49736.1 hypothetical protein BFR34_04470 [Brochothrix thermosphacta DSM 20171 = FSL F6-1036]ODJ55438.1 hypothetical protein BFR38_09210 [Brochothrix thermosphacta]ODJ61352.1 hypothetical protein BFR42_09300 [Brochothrix thermosphacta]